jgi:hypothetical protein
MQAAARGMTAMRRAIAGGPTGSVSFLQSQNAQLTSMLAMQRQAIANMTRLGNAGGGGRGGFRRGGVGRGGAGGGGGHASGVMGSLSGHVGFGSIARGTFAAGTSREIAITVMRERGEKESEISKIVAKAEQLTKENPSRTLADNLNAIKSLTAAMGGDLDQALGVSKATTEAAFILRFNSGNRMSTEAADESMYDLARAGELKGVINKPEELRNLSAASSRPTSRLAATLIRGCGIRT